LFCPTRYPDLRFYIINNMATPDFTEFTFVHAPARNQARRLDKKKWEDYKDKILKKRLEMSLPNLVNYMKESHGFIAT
jgi:hypothetical protein